jgi:hypothetical protein
MDIKLTELIINKCDRVVQVWAQRTPTLELVEDFARALGFQLEFKLVPLVSVFAVPAEGPHLADEPPNDETPDEPQYELFNEMSAEDKYAMKSWRSNNGL